MAKRSTYDDPQENFSGGIIESQQVAAFSERSMSIAKGFILEDESTLRSQPACQKVGSETGFQAIRGYSASNANYLVGITTAGVVKYMIAPSPNSPNSSTRTETWETIAGVPANPGYRFLNDNDSFVDDDLLRGGRVNALLISNASSNVTSLKLYEPFTGQGLLAKTYTKRFPVDTVVNNTTTPSTGNFPPANVGAILGSRLFLGDTLYNRDFNQPLSASNNKRYQSGIWFSEADTSTFFGLAYLFPASTEAQIRAMHVLDNKLIIITTPGPEGDGIITVSGDFTGPAEAATIGEVSAKINLKILRGGTGATRQTSLRHLNYSCVWPEAGSVIFIDTKGGVWATEGTVVEQIDMFGPKAVNLALETDHVAALGRNLFVSRGNRLLVSTILGLSADDSATAQSAWTELVTPGNAKAMSMTPLVDSIYFLSGGQPYRYSWGNHPTSERGLIDGQPVTLRFGTRTHGDPGPQENKSWLRFGFTARGIQNARVNQVAVKAGPALGDPGEYVTVPSDRDITENYQAWLNAGIGLQATASAVIDFTGDLIFNSYEWKVNGTDPRRDNGKRS